MDRRYDVAAVADLFADIIVRGREAPRFGQAEVFADSYSIEVGGSAPIFASQVAKLGGRAALIGAVGDDMLGDLVKGRLAAAGVDVSRVVRFSAHPTPLGLNLAVDGDRAMVTVLGAIEELGAAVLASDVLESARHWHIAGYFLLEGLLDHWPALVQTVKRHGATVSLDSNWAPRGDWSRLQAVLGRVDLFLPNEAEACAISGCADWAAAGRELAKLCPLVVVKRGELGAAAFTAGRIFEADVPADALRDRPFVDAVGAGDSFDGGFVWAWLQRKPIEECLRVGIACGAASTRAAGGTAGQLTSVAAVIA